MKLKLHFLPEKPAESSRVIVFHSWGDGELSSVTDTFYSVYWDAFYARDDDEKLLKSTKEANKTIVAWCYFDEAREEFQDEIIG